jgi:hypothetical protein
MATPRTSHAVARSISRSVSEHLRGDQFGARVLAVFDHACDLVTPEGDVIALVSSRIGDGPLNIVVKDAADLLPRISPDAPVMIGGHRLQIGQLEVDLSRATTWEPRPDWDVLRARRPAIAARLPLLWTACHRETPGCSLLALLNPPMPPAGPDQLTLSTARQAAQALQEGWDGDLERLQRGVTGLAGLGGGLTPAGDDFLVGAMLWAWIAHPAPAALCRTIAQAAVPRTTTLSAAFLRAAARGECGGAWHALLAALSEGDEDSITVAARGIVARGATSGADGLAGFLLQPWGTG